MGDLTPNFDRFEFACKGKNCCGHSAPISMVLVRALQQLRDDLCTLLGHDVLIYIHSGFRCLTHNREVGSSDDSQHPLGTAVDCHTDEILPEELAALAEGIPEFHGIGIYPWGCHFDVREGGPVTWSG